jgi:hypothetical protein
MNYGGSWRNAWEPVHISDEDVMALHSMCDFLLTDTTPRKIMISDDHIYVYANDPGIYHRILNHGLALFKELLQVQLTGIPDTVHLKRSDHAMRSYLRSRKLDAATATSVRKWLIAQESVRLSPSLRYWCENGHRLLYTYYFFDHNSVHTVDMLHLIAPNIIRCTLPIVTDK